MRGYFRPVFHAFLIVLFTGWAANALADDPPSRVGGISFISGAVSLHASDETQWSPATLNYPVIGGYSFWAEPNSRAEIRIGSVAMRLDASTELDITHLDDQTLQVEVPQGTINIHMDTIDPGQIYQVVTPRGTIDLLQPGTYRINAGTQITPTEVAVLRGQARISNSDSSLTVAAGETALTSNSNPVSYAMQETAATPFDNWSLERDNFEEPHAAARYVSAGMTGYDNLDSYGSWQTTPDYGAVWIPASVPAGWEPYHYGHWTWVAPWGWTWVDDQPWGFAPFHYGRWARWHNRWGWIPGAVVPHPVYAPALVAFVGGANWNLSLSLGGGHAIGWFPLGPNEVYHPPYRVSDRYVRNLNATNVRDITNITNVTNISNSRYTNRQFTTVVHENDFSASHPVARAAIKVSAAKIAAAPVNDTAVPPLIHDPRIGEARSEAPPRAPLSRPQIQEQNHASAPNNRPTVVDHPGSSAQPNQQQIATPSAPRAPGPPMHPHIPAIAAVQPTPHAAEASTPEERRYNFNPQNHPAVAPQNVPAMHEVSVQRPVQRAPLVASHKGWVRKQPEQARPQPRAKPVGPSPAGKPSEQPHEQNQRDQQHP